MAEEEYDNRVGADAHDGPSGRVDQQESFEAGAKPARRGNNCKFWVWAGVGVAVLVAIVLSITIPLLMKDDKDDKKKGGDGGKKRYWKPTFGEKNIECRIGVEANTVSDSNLDFGITINGHLETTKVQEGNVIVSKPKTPTCTRNMDVMSCFFDVESKGSEPAITPERFMDELQKLLWVKFANCGSNSNSEATSSSSLWQGIDDVYKTSIKIKLKPGCLVTNIRTDDYWIKRTDDQALFTVLSKKPKSWSLWKREKDAKQLIQEACPGSDPSIDESDASDIGTNSGWFVYKYNLKIKDPEFINPVAKKIIGNHAALEFTSGGNTYDVTIQAKNTGAGDKTNYKYVAKVFITRSDNTIDKWDLEQQRQLSQFFGDNIGPSFVSMKPQQAVLREDMFNNGDQNGVQSIQTDGSDQRSTVPAITMKMVACAGQILQTNKYRVKFDGNGNSDNSYGWQDKINKEEFETFAQKHCGSDAKVLNLGGIMSKPAPQWKEVTWQVPRPCPTRSKTFYDLDASAGTGRFTVWGPVWYLDSTTVTLYPNRESRDVDSLKDRVEKIIRDCEGGKVDALTSFVVSASECKGEVVALERGEFKFNNKGEIRLCMEPSEQWRIGMTLALKLPCARNINPDFSQTGEKCDDGGTDVYFPGQHPIDNDGNEIIQYGFKYALTVKSDCLDILNTRAAADGITQEFEDFIQIVGQLPQNPTFSICLRRGKGNQDIDNWLKTQCPEEKRPMIQQVFKNTECGKVWKSEYQGRAHVESMPVDGSGNRVVQNGFDYSVKLVKGKCPTAGMERKLPEYVKFKESEPENLDMTTMCIQNGKSDQDLQIVLQKICPKAKFRVSPVMGTSCKSMWDSEYTGQAPIESKPLGHDEKPMELYGFDYSLDVAGECPIAGLNNLPEYFQFWQSNPKNLDGTIMCIQKGTNPQDLTSFLRKSCPKASIEVRGLMPTRCRSRWSSAYTGLLHSPDTARGSEARSQMQQVVQISGNNAQNGWIYSVEDVSDGKCQGGIPQTMSLPDYIKLDRQNTICVEGQRMKNAQDFLQELCSSSSLQLVAVKGQCTFTGHFTGQHPIDDNGNEIIQNGFKYKLPVNKDCLSNLKSLSADGISDEFKEFIHIPGQNNGDSQFSICLRRGKNSHDINNWLNTRCPNERPPTFSQAMKDTECGNVWQSEYQGRGQSQYALLLLLFIAFAGASCKAMRMIKPADDDTAQFFEFQRIM